jgi:hypothetical protein
MFPMSHTLSKSVNISKRYNKANLTHMCEYLDVITVWYMHPLIGPGMNELNCIALLSPVYVQCGARQISWEVPLTTLQKSAASDPHHA